MKLFLGYLFSIGLWIVRVGVSIFIVFGLYTFLFNYSFTQSAEEDKSPEIFPIAVLYTDELSNEKVVQVMWQYDVEEFKKLHPEYSFLVTPEYANSVLVGNEAKRIGGFEIKNETINGKYIRAWEVGNGVNTGWYWATEKTYTPVYHRSYNAIAFGIPAFLSLIVCVPLCVFIMKKIEVKIRRMKHAVSNT